MLRYVIINYVGLVLLVANSEVFFTLYNNNDNLFHDDKHGKKWVYIMIFT